MPNTASSNGFTIAPRPNTPKSPPLTAEPGSSEYFLANTSNCLGDFLTSAKIPSAFFLISAFFAGVAAAPNASKIWLARRFSSP